MYYKDTAGNFDRLEMQEAAEVAEVKEKKNATSGATEVEFKAGKPAVTAAMLNQGLIKRVKRFSDNKGVIQVKGPIHVDFFKGNNFLRLTKSKKIKNKIIFKVIAFCYRAFRFK
jgi:hypothetical protein